MLSTIPYTALLSPTPIFSSSSIAVLMFWPWPPMHVDAHTTLYTLHSIPYTALLGPIPIFSSSSIAFLMFWPSPPMHVKDRPYLTLHSLHSSPPTFTLQTPVLNLTPIFSSYSSSSIAFLLFWPPPMHVHGRTRRESNPTATQLPPGTSAAKPTTVATPNGWGTASNWSLSARLPPRPPILTSFAMSNFSQAWQLAFVIMFAYTSYMITRFIPPMTRSFPPPPQIPARSFRCVRRRGAPAPPVLWSAARRRGQTSWCHQQPGSQIPQKDGDNGDKGIIPKIIRKKNMVRGRSCWCM